MGTLTAPSRDDRGGPGPNLESDRQENRAWVPRDATVRAFRLELTFGQPSRSLAQYYEHH
jgi:hypothetical protein